MAGSLRSRHDEVDLPTFQFGGWYDVFTQGPLDRAAQRTTHHKPSTELVHVRVTANRITNQPNRQAGTAQPRSRVSP
ncbi:hypothetical protein ACOT81_43065 [Streptomyces sp. WI04-05B]|uniref:hypothetical protein n=1 Tax=Streptomyces TaxID=1883 RepID=UPI0029A7F2E3|nr:MULTISPECIES: hypothetical protein [unclassified Streptomyces]MDX2543401.1 hypothetical protein [Streptomyces sp. WI04-05B]MDX2586803.1 hypothetical protein [Streptomyces sp. WI04-05A]MDX3748453.1 hypothetical protein [Streptomyces sp. AK08-02]